MKRAVSRFIPNKLGKSTGADIAPSTKIDSSSIDDFYISLDSPHKSWLPGEEISGQVILISSKHLANIAIVFSLCGYIKIHASPQLKLRSVKKSLFNHTITIFGPEPSSSHNTQNHQDEFVNGLYKGEHRFPFVVKLPKKRIFTSVDFGKGAIEYVLKSSIRSAASLASDSSSSSSPSGHPSPSASSDLFSKARSFSRFSSAPFTSEKIITLINPIDVAELPPPKPKRLIINDPRRNKKLSRVQSSASTANTFSTMSSNNSDYNETTPLSHNSAGSLLRPQLLHDCQLQLLHHHSLSNSHAPLATHNALQLSHVHTSTSTQSHPHTQLSPGNSGPSNFSPPSLADHLRPNTIKVSMELSQSGFLRGELIPIKLNIHHLKQVQDTTGIIVTLVRVCRLDYGPDGLYESFRKDLSQSVIPLFVDPSTFQLEINTSLRVPPDAFPTIVGCPLVLFQYFIEVMLNLSGKSLSLEGPSDHPKSNIGPADELMTSNAGLSPGNQSNYAYHAYQNRSEFINTDKFKRLKKFLQITSEVIIGTFRLDKTVSHANNAPAATAPSPDSQTALLNASRRTSDASNSNSTNSSNQLNTRSSSNRSNSRNVRIGAIPEAVPMNHFFTPPYAPSDNFQSQDSPNSSPQANAPTYDDITADMAMPDHSHLPEKERARLFEQSLLPSEPQFDTPSDTEDRETISPMDHNHDNFDAMVAGSMLPTSPRNERFTFSFPPPEQPTLSPHLNDDLYESQNQPDIHEGIGLEGAKDFVPNYDNAANDELVPQSQ